MTQIDIKQLLEKFYAGDTAPEEERHLKDYFLNSECVDEHLEKDRTLFRALYGKPHKMSQGVSVRLEATLQRLGDNERRTASRTRTLRYLTGSVAAVALLCAGLFFATRTDTRRTMADTYDNPEEAALMAEKTLLYVSAELNRGIEQTYVVRQEMEKMNKVLETFKTNN
ncbi:MAG: hypothetical protein LBS42_03040 [Tannerella sp.]|jgi:hypothetical protein|nr:hypothetical protein [Tannerella sp.]